MVSVKLQSLYTDQIEQTGTIFCHKILKIKIIKISQLNKQISAQYVYLSHIVLARLIIEIEIQNGFEKQVLIQFITSTVLHLKLN